MPRGTFSVYLLVVLLLATAVSTSAFAESGVIGSVTGSVEATVGGKAVLPNTAIYSGDSLEVGNGMAVVTMDHGSRMVFDRQTAVSFERSPESVSVTLLRGNVTFYHPGESTAVRIKAGDIVVSPERGVLTQGGTTLEDVTVMINTTAGMLRVEGYGPTVVLRKGETTTLSARVTHHRKKKAAYALLEVGAVSAGAAVALTCVVNAFNNSLNSGSASPFKPPSGICP